VNGERGERLWCQVWEEHIDDTTLAADGCENYEEDRGRT
jgi:hypothetical protein